MYSFLRRQAGYYERWDFVLFTCLTLLAVVNGQSTIFYIIYFFWWNELIRLLVDRFFMSENPNCKTDGPKKHIGTESFFLMGIYVVFIVVFFGFMANFENTDIMATNIQVLFFRNWFFNLNLLIVLAERILLHRTKQPVTVYTGGFTPNMIILHISIITGGLLMFFVVKKYPETFTPANLWGSVIIILPFIVLKKIVYRFV